MAAKQVLVTGATGATGGSAALRLLELGVPVRALVHRADARSERLAAAGAAVVLGDLSDFDAVARATEGVAAAYFVYPIQVPGILEATALFAQAAGENGVGAVVNMSQITARRDSESRAARDHWIAERLLDRAGVPVTHLRPTLFCEWLTYFAQAIREQSVLPLPFGDARYAPIAAADQGRAIAAILTDPAPHAGRTYPLYGPRELGQRDVADLLTRALGRTIAYVPMEAGPFDEILRERGFTEHFRQHVAAIARDCRAGICSGTNDLVERLTGRKPQEMSDYIDQNKATFA